MLKGTENGVDAMLLEICEAVREVYIGAGDGVFCDQE
jgi:hypothetical protein